MGDEKSHSPLDLPNGDQESLVAPVTHRPKLQSRSRRIFVVVKHVLLFGFIWTAIHRWLFSLSFSRVSFIPHKGLDDDNAWMIDAYTYHDKPHVPHGHLAEGFYL